MRILRWINGNTWKDKITGYETFLDIWWSNVLVCVWIEIILSASASTFCFVFFVFVFFLGPAPLALNSALRQIYSIWGSEQLFKKKKIFVFNFQ